MANTVPVNDSRAVTELIVTTAREHGRVAVHPIGCVTKRMEGHELAEMHDMLQAGACAFSDDGKPVWSSLIMRKALEYSRIFDVAIIDHCEDPVLVDGGVMHEGEVSTRLGLQGWPGVAEDVMVQRDLLLADYTGGHVHIAHLSTGRAADFVRRAKEDGVRATCEVTPHHLALTHEAVGDYDNGRQDESAASPRRGPAEAADGDCRRHGGCHRHRSRPASFRRKVRRVLGGPLRGDRSRNGGLDLSRPTGARRGDRIEPGWSSCSQPGPAASCDWTRAGSRSAGLRI